MSDAPTGRFLRELEEVARDARALREHVGRTSNAPLPEAFPEDYVKRLTIMLEGLPKGTIDGALRGLQMGRVRMPTLRSTYLPVDAADHSDRHPDNERGGLLDRLIKALLGSISSAIAQYEDDTGNSLNLEITPDDSLPAEEQSDLGLSDIMKEARDAQQEVGALEEGIDKVPEEVKTPELEALDRGLADTDIGLKATQAEASHPRPRGTILKDTGSWLLRRGDEVLTLVENAEMIADPGFEALSQIYKRTSQGMIDSVRGTLKNIQDVARATRETGRRISTILVEKRSTYPPLPDFDPEAVHEMLLRGERPPQHWRPYIASINLEFRSEFTDTGLLSGLTALEWLSLYGTGVSDVSALSGLTVLEMLSLYGTDVSDVSALSGLTALKALNLYGTGVSDVSALSGLTALEFLDLYGTGVSDVSALSGLTALETLSLYGTGVSDVSALSGLTALKTLNLYGTGVSDVSALSGLTALEWLDLDGTGVSDVSALSGLTALKMLNLYGTGVSDLSPIQHLIDAGLNVIGP